MNIHDLEPKECFGHFAAIAEIPRGSGREKQISDYIMAFAAKRGLFAVQDAKSNVLVKKPATKGMEGAPAVILQGHLDMVQVSAAGHAFDFANRPIALKVEGDALTADRTTLGADNGIAIAYILALLDSKDIPHPPLECVLTTEEETGMGGAAAFNVSNLTGRYFINIDTEKEGVFCASCAGSRRSRLTLPLETTPFAALAPLSGGDGFHFFTLGVKGLAGGHSGIEIDKQRGNSNRLLGRALAALVKKYDLHLAKLSGGVATNAIPAESSALICTNADQMSLQKDLEGLQAAFAKELAASDGAGLRLTLEAAEKADALFTKETRDKALLIMTLLPHGVEAMDLHRADQTLVESSNNFAMMETKDGAVIFSCFTRSSIASKKEFICSQLEAVARAAGAALTYGSDSPAWEYAAESPLRETFKAAYKALFGKEAGVKGIHAGLECGIFFEKLRAAGKAVDIISFGPDQRGAHTPEESLGIASAGRTWALLKEALKRIGQEKA